mgnify:CR=1 FL=1
MIHNRDLQLVRARRLEGVKLCTVPQRPTFCCVGVCSSLTQALAVSGLPVSFSTRLRKEAPLPGCSQITATESSFQC